jgi:hypothetical protein
LRLFGRDGKLGRFGCADEPVATVAVEEFGVIEIAVEIAGLLIGAAGNTGPAVPAALSQGLGGETDAINLSTAIHRDGRLASYSSPKWDNDVEARPKGYLI